MKNGFRKVLKKSVIPFTFFEDRNIWEKNLSWQVTAEWKILRHLRDSVEGTGICYEGIGHEVIILGLHQTI